MKKISSVLSIVFFFSTLVILAVATIVSDKQSFSETENRTLAELPSASANSVLNKSYMNGIENYLSDYFPMRDKWVTAMTSLEQIMGHKQVGGVLLLEDRMVAEFNNIDDSTVNTSINAINTFSQQHDIPMYVMIAPTAIGVYTDELPANYTTIDQKYLIDQIYVNLNSKITTLNAYSALYSTRDEYTYFRTDHHWTPLGAFYAYSETIGKMGYEAVPFSNYNIEHVSDSFYGTLYSEAPNYKYRSDSIDVFNVKKGSTVTEVIQSVNGKDEKFDSMYFYDELDKKNKYQFYLGNSTTPITTIKTDCENDAKLLVVKDSYAQCLVPFYTQHYSEITILDLRTTGPFGIDALVDVSEYDQMLIVYNLANFTEDANIEKLGL